MEEFIRPGASFGPRVSPVINQLQLPESIPSFEINMISNQGATSTNMLEISGRETDALDKLMIEICPSELNTPDVGAVEEFNYECSQTAESLNMNNNYGWAENSKSPASPAFYTDGFDGKSSSSDREIKELLNEPIKKIKQMEVSDSERKISDCMIEKISPHLPMNEDSFQNYDIANDQNVSESMDFSLSCNNIPDANYSLPDKNVSPAAQENISRDLNPIFDQCLVPNSGEMCNPCNEQLHHFNLDSLLNQDFSQLHDSDFDEQIFDSINEDLATNGRNPLEAAIKKEGYCEGNQELIDSFLIKDNLPSQQSHLPNTCPGNSSQSSNFTPNENLKESEINQRKCENIHPTRSLFVSSPQQNLSLVLNQNEQSQMKPLVYSIPKHIVTNTGKKIEIRVVKHAPKECTSNSEFKEALTTEYSSLAMPNTPMRGASYDVAPKKSSRKIKPTPKYRKLLEYNYPSSDEEIDLPDDPSTFKSKISNIPFKELSDAEKYRRIREQNNLASKKCREKNKRKKLELANEKKSYMQRNDALKQKLSILLNKRDRYLEICKVLGIAYSVN